MEPKTRTILLYGKDGKGTGPTKAYPQPKVITQVAELVKDFGEMSVWKFEPDPTGKNPDYWVSFHGKNGGHTGGGACKTQEDAFKRVEDAFVMREYETKKRELWRSYEAGLAALNEEYKGRV